MPREPRAVLFDLDDTLYPQRRFVVSGFAAVARHLAARRGVRARLVFDTLCAAHRRGERGAELQACLASLGLSPDLVWPLVEVMRAHRPSLRLPPASRRTLVALRAAWRIGIVTNGIPSVQAAKVEALGLRRLVDVVVFAAEHGSGMGKPDPEPFEAALGALEVPADRAVFVGDSEPCDIVGAAAAGLRTVRVWSPRAAAPPSTRADALAASIEDVPAIAGALLQGAWSRHVA